MTRAYRCATAVLILLICPHTVSQDVHVQNGRLATFKELLQERHIELTIPSLVEALRNPDAQVRYLAALTLAEDRVTNAVPEIINVLDAEEAPQTKANLAFALAQLGNPKGFKTLRSMCNEQDVPAYLRVYATKYLLDLDDESCLHAILEVMHSKSGFSSRTLALSELPRFRPVSVGESHRIVTVTARALADSMPDVRIVASDTLADLAAQAAIPSLENAIVKEQDETVRSRMEANLQRVREKKDW